MFLQPALGIVLLLSTFNTANVVTSFNLTPIKPIATLHGTFQNDVAGLYTFQPASDASVLEHTDSKPVAVFTIKPLKGIELR